MALVPQGDTSFLRRRSASDICDAFAQCCPKCQQAGKIIKLKYYQINFQEAIYLCADEDCGFPFSESNIDSFVIQRSISEFKAKRRRKKRLASRAVDEMPASPQIELPLSSSDTMDQLERFLNNSALLTMDVVESPQLFNMESQQLQCKDDSVNSPNSLDMTNVFDGLDSVFMKIPDADQFPEEDTFLPYEKKCCLSKTSTESKDSSTSNSESTTPYTMNIVEQALQLMQSKNGQSWLDTLLNSVVKNASIRAFLNEQRDTSSLSTNIFCRLCNVYDCQQASSNTAKDDGEVNSITAKQSYDKMYANIRQEIFKTIQGADQAFHELFSIFFDIDSNLRELFTQTSDSSTTSATNESKNLGTYPIRSSLALKLTPLLSKCENKRQVSKDVNCKAKTKFGRRSKAPKTKSVLKAPKTSMAKITSEPKQPNSTTEKPSSISETEKNSSVTFSADDMEMLTEACKELKSSPPSPISPSNGFVVEPLVSDHGPLTELKQVFVPYTIAVKATKRRANSSLLKLKDSLKTKPKTPEESFNNENSVSVFNPQSKLTEASLNLKGFDAFQSKWPKTKVASQKCQLTGYRKNDLKRICSSLNQKSFLSLASPMPQLPRYHAKAITNGSSLLSPELADNAPDLDVFSNSSDLSDIFPDLDLLSNCST